MRIYDCFSFLDELDLLEIRLKHLWNEVDYFVLTEGDRTYEGEKKTSFYLQNQARFAWAASKIIHVQESLEDAPSSRWQNEDILRRAYLRGIQSAQPEDMIAFSCIEDLFSTQLLQDLRNGKIVPPSLVVLDCYRYFINGRVLGPLSYWPYPVLAKRSQIETSITDFWENRFSYRAVRKGGWHFSELGKSQTDDVLFKLSENNRIHYAELDHSFPSYLMENQDHFKHLLHPVNASNDQSEHRAILQGNEIHFFRQLELGRTVSRLEKQLSLSTSHLMAMNHRLELTIESERKVFYDLRKETDGLVQEVGVLRQKINAFENSRLIKMKNRLKRLKEKFV